MNKLKFAVIFLGIFASVFAREYKNIKKSFNVEADKLIVIESISGLDINVKSWDKNEILFDLRADVSSSDEEYEIEYIEALDIVERHRNSTLKIKFVETRRTGGWSFWDIFKGKFGFSFSKEIKGDIYVPRANPLKADFKYSIIELSDMTGEINLLGRSNELYLNDCENIFTIENDYGENYITNSGGELNLSSRSSTVNINDFDGPVKIFADYSNIKIKGVTSTLDLKTRSAEVSVEDIDSDLNLSADYSKVVIKNVNGYADLKNLSGSFDVTNVKGIKIDAAYTNCDIDNITGLLDKDIEITNRSGNVVIEKAMGNIIVNDSYSDITLKSVEGDVSLTSRSSTVIGNDIKGNWESETSYCDVRLEKISGSDVFIENRGNPVTIELLKNPESVNVKNSYGSISLTIPEDYNGEVTLLATYGKIDSDFPIRVNTQGSSANAFGQIGKGNSEITLETVSADIDLMQRK